jgi:alpha/beta superfamily hydrolase
MSKREERAVAIPQAGGTQALEGIYIAGSDADAVGIIIAAPHPLYGGSMDSPVVNEIAYAARAAGLASLRFNWRGVGASAGSLSGEAADADADYHAALDHLLETLSGVVVAAGYSFGAAAAARVAVKEPRVRRLLLVAPPPALLDTASLAAFGGDVLIAAGAEDRIAPVAELAAVAAALPKGRCEVIRATDHFFGSGLADLGRVAGSYLKGA